MEKVFARDWFFSPLSVAVARTSQSPSPLAEILYKQTDEIKVYSIFTFFYKFYFWTKYRKNNNTKWCCLQICK